MVDPLTHTLTCTQTHAGALGNHCNVLQGLGSENYSDAEACYQRVTKSHPNYDRAWVNLGGLYYVTGCVCACVAVCCVWVQTFEAWRYPTHTRMIDPRQLEEAAAAYVRALEVSPDNALARHALGALQVRETGENGRGLWCWCLGKTYV